MAEHSARNDTNLRALAGGILAAYAGTNVEDFEERSDASLRSTQHRSRTGLGRGHLEFYAPIVELLAY